MGKCFQINNIDLCQFLSFTCIKKCRTKRRNQATNFTYLEGRNIALLQGTSYCLRLQSSLRDKTIIWGFSEMKTVSNFVLLELKQWYEKALKVSRFWPWTFQVSLPHHSFFGQTVIVWSTVINTYCSKCIVFTAKISISQSKYLFCWRISSFVNKWQGFWL